MIDCTEIKLVLDKGRLAGTPAPPSLRSRITVCRVLSCNPRDIHLVSSSHPSDEETEAVRAYVTYIRL